MRTFLQPGFAERTGAVVVGLTRDWPRHWRWASGRIGGYWELAIGRWRSHDEPGDPGRFYTQLAVTPVFRYRGDDGAARWFVEGAIGVSLISPRYRGDGPRLSTTFNFGDHLAIGTSFGARSDHEIALRFQHFSNGSINKPNPGVNFVQLRYSRQLD